MRLHTLLKALPFQNVPTKNPEILAVTQDNRDVQKGSLFICIKGLNVDGHLFAEDAQSRGAVAIISEKPLTVTIPVIIVSDTKRAMAMLADSYYGQPTKGLRLIGITGTNGKTTISHLIEQIFSDSGHGTGIIGTMYMKMGEKTYETPNTTPDSLTLQKTFRKMCDSNVDTAIMEVSSHALVQGRTYGCDYDIAIFTNLTQDHLDYHETMDRYRQAKGLLFSQLGNTYSTTHPKVAIFNNDDDATTIYKPETAAYVITYGINNKADFMAKNIIISAKGTTFTLYTAQGEWKVHLQLIGMFSVYNVLAAIACAFVSGLQIDDAVESLERVAGVSGRFEVVDVGQSFSVVVDYAHTPDSLENVLETVQQFAKKRVFVVVGCGGDRDRMKRPLMAEIACRYGTDPIFTSDNPRSEEPNAILDDMVAGVPDEKVVVIPDRKQAITFAVSSAEEDDIIIIAGKGHETYQIIGDNVFDFDDRIVAAEAIEQNK